jgi:hypothetical protein
MKPAPSPKPFRGATIAATAGGAGLAVLMTAGIGAARADTVQTERSYPDRPACQDAGPGARATTQAIWSDFW